MGRKHFKKFERVRGSFLELKEVVIRRTLRFWSDFHGRVAGNSRLKH